MAFISITPAMTDQFIAALCNTLVHSLWQGLLLSVVTGLIILSTRKASSATRYNLLIGSLVLFAVGVIATFAFQIKRGQPETVSQILQAPQVSVQPMANNTLASAPIPNKSFADSLFDYLSNHHNTIVLIWFLIICAKSVQLGIGLLGIRRLKTVQVNTVDAYWATKLKHLAHTIGVSEPVKLLESGLAKIPMAVGHLKPVILIPIGLLTALSTAEVEAILIHELAHIKRRDYLVNLLQSLMEIVFFFNPAVLWVSQLIKTERENCCDDMAVAQSSNKVNYIRALVNCQEYQQAVPAYAMAFPGGKDSLMDRVRRMASNRNHSLNVFEKTVLAVCLVASGLCLSAFSQKEKIEVVANKVATVIHEINASAKQTTAVKKQTEALKVQTKLIKKTTPILATAEQASRTSTNGFATDFSGILSPLTGQLDSLKECVTPFEARADVKLNVLSNLDVKNHITLNADTGKKVYTYHANYKSNTAVYNQTYTMNFKPDSGRLVPTVGYVNPNLHPNPRPNPHPNPKPNPHPNPHPNPKPNPHPNPKVSLPRIDSLHASDTRVRLSGLKINLSLPVIGQQLYDAGLISDKENYKVILNSDELIVNGVKQSEDAHQLMLKKYQKKPADKVDMNFSRSK